MASEFMDKFFKELDDCKVFEKQIESMDTREEKVTLLILNKSSPNPFIRHTVRLSLKQIGITI